MRSIGRVRCVLQHRPTSPARYARTLSPQGRRGLIISRVPYFVQLSRLNTKPSGFKWLLSTTISLLKTMIAGNSTSGIM
jgi:hypothetical protein